MAGQTVAALVQDPDRPVGQVDIWLSQRRWEPDSAVFRRRILAHYTGVAPQDLRFTQGEHGKPQLLGAGRQWRFNVSHSGDWIVCAVGRVDALGVDVEQTRQHRDPLRLAQRFFHRSEFATLRALPQAAQHDYFYDLWTLKEAWVKARGESLPPRLPQLLFELDYPVADNGPGQIRLLSQSLARCEHLLLFDPLPDLRMALCVCAGVARPPVPQFFIAREGAGSAVFAVAPRALSFAG